MKLKLPMDDGVSFGLWIAALMLTMYLSLFNSTHLLVVPIFLMIGGIVIQLAVAGKLEHDPSISSEEATQTSTWVFVTLAVMMAGTIVIPSLFLPSSVVQLAIIDATLLGILYAISEERFFRGGLHSYLLLKFNNPFAISLVNGLIFMVFHTAVYGTRLDLMGYTFTAGFMFSYATCRTNRLTAATVAHIVNNVLAVSLMVGGGMIA